MIRLCLDTSAYSRLMRGQPKLQERLEFADEILLPATMLGEIYTGFQGGARQQENLALLAAFRSQPGVVVIDTTDNIAQRYAVIVAALKRQGTPIPTNDIWIAAAALENGGRVVAFVGFFSPAGTATSAEIEAGKAAIERERTVDQDFLWRLPP